MGNSFFNYKQKLRGGFTQIPNSFLQKPPQNVSTEAWMLYLFLFSQSKEYVPTIETIAKQRNNSISKVKRLVAELTEAHYLKIERMGRNKYHWLLYPSPHE